MKRETSSQSNEINDTTQKKMKLKSENGHNKIKKEYSGYNLETGNGYNNFGSEDNSSLFIFKRKKGQI